MDTIEGPQQLRIRLKQVRTTGLLHTSRTSAQPRCTGGSPSRTQRWMAARSVSDFMLTTLESTANSTPRIPGTRRDENWSADWTLSPSTWSDLMESQAEYLAPISRS